MRPGRAPRAPSQPGGAGAPALGAARRERARAHPDERVAAIAVRQHGLVTLAQLRAAGLRRGAVALRVRAGRLHPVHRGVFAVGTPPLAPLAREAAALLACGPGAVVSHDSAALLWGIAERPRRPVHITVRGPHRRRHEGVRPHIAPTLADEDVDRRHGLPLTSVPRTLLDLAASLGERDLRWAVEEARVQRLLRDGELAAVLDRYPRRRGAARVRRVAAGIEREPVLTRSEAERRLLDLLRSARLPLPRANAGLRGSERDFHWDRHRLVVEVDGFASHGTRSAFERDRRRDAELQAAGLRAVRITWRQLVDEREAVVALLARLLVDPPPDGGR